MNPSSAARAVAVSGALAMSVGITLRRVCALRQRRALRAHANDEQALAFDVPPVSSAEGGFTLGSYNLLTKNFYRRSYSDYCTDRDKSWAYRLQLYQRLIPHMNFDILAVQEAHVGSFAKDFAFVGECGYGIVEPWDKEAKRGPEKADRLAKTALLYKRDVFELVWEDHRSRTLLCSLRHRLGHVVYIVNCHLEGNPEKVADRFTQLKSAFKIVERHQRNSGIDPAQANLVVCGDFNAGRECTPYTLLAEGMLPAGHTDPWAPDTVVTKDSYALPYKLKDVYRTIRGPNKLTFLANKRPSLIDFIFVSQHMSVHSNKEPYSDTQWEVAERTGIPNAWHPSDHFAIGTSLSF